MAELLVRIAPRGPGEGQRLQAGDIVAVMPDGHPWGTQELRDDSPWVIIHVPGTTPDDFADESAPVIGPPKDEPLDKDPAPIRARRAMSLDLTNASLRSAIRGGGKRITLGRGVFNATRRAKPETEVAALERGDVVIVDDPRA